MSTAAVLSIQKEPSGPSVSNKAQLLARARYNNIAESEDELSFRQGDIVTVLKKDFNQQLDWWLCELRGKVGMVPANYLEIFHDHEHCTYDIPRPSSKSASASPRTTPLPPAITMTDDDDVDNPIYDLPPADAEITDRDYDLPPPDAPDGGFETTCDRPPSSTRLSPVGSMRSSVKSNNRISVSSSGSRNSNSIYDVPPELADVYDFPKPTVPAKGFETEEKETILLAVDISSMYDYEAEELLTSYRQLMSATYDVLYQTVYGPEAYWGNENKTRRVATLKRTIQGVKHFDRALVALLEFGKGVVNTLGTSSDANFKKKYTSAFRGLLQNRNSILTKLEQLSSEIDSVTATVKALLEIARTIPKAVTEFTVLIRANKALLFKVSKSMSASNLPVITKNEVKVRPLPELPTTQDEGKESREGDYALPVEAPGVDNGRKTPEKMLSESNLDYNTVLRKRKPNDHLPPLPYAAATMPKPSKKGPPVNDQLPPRSGSPYGNNVPRQGSPLLIRQSEDYDEITDKLRDRAVVLTKRPSLASLGSGSSSGPSPIHKRREQSLSSCSGSSDDIAGGGGGIALRRVNSADLLDGPYGRANGYHRSNHARQTSSPQPLREQDKELLDRFSKQLDLIVPSLRETIDFFLNCLKENEPPRDFVTKSKLTVVAAYKLVYIADALTQKILHSDTKASILAASNRLTDSIKSLVSATKTAALQYPSVIAKDKMSDSLRLLFPAALDLINSVKARASLV